MVFLLNIVDLGPHGSFLKGVLRTKLSRKNYSQSLKICPGLSVKLFIACPGAGFGLRR